jgi:DDE superfamily endonuclease/Winged helix-turn helix
VRHFLSTRVGFAYCRERVRQLLHALGFRLRRLRHRHLKAKAEAQAIVRAELEALWEEWPEGWAWLCVDEATLRRHPPLTAPWGLADEVPEVPTGDEPARVQVYGAGGPLTGRTHDHISPTLAKEAVATCLRQLAADYPGKRLLVIHDRGAHHRGAAIAEVAREACGPLVRKAQPAYSPELNPQARIRTWRRRVVTHHHGLATLQEQIAAIRHVFRSLAGVKAQVRRLCGFKSPDSLVASL